MYNYIGRLFETQCIFHNLSHAYAVATIETNVDWIRVEFSSSLAGKI